MGLFKKHLKISDQTKDPKLQYLRRKTNQEEHGDPEKPKKTRTLYLE